MNKVFYFFLALFSNFLAFNANGQTAPEIQGNCASPAYPSASTKLEEEGTVTIRFLVGTDGKVKNADIEKSTGFRRLDEAARSALIKCQFKTSIKDGIPVEGFAKMNFEFRLGAPRIPSVLYRVSASNGKLLKSDARPKMQFSSFSTPEYLSIDCRLSNNPLYVSAQNISINKYIEDAFNSELKAADLYADQGLLMTADIKRITAVTFPSGSWNLEIDIKLNNGKKITYFHSHEFVMSTMDGLQSCPKAAQEFPTAIQKLFYKIASDTEFLEATK